MAHGALRILIILCNVAQVEASENHDARAKQHERAHDGPELEHQPVDRGVGCERHKGDLALGFVLQPPGELVYGPDPRQVCGRAQEQAIGCVCMDSSGCGCAHILG